MLILLALSLSWAVIYTLAVSLLVCVPLAVVEIKRGALLSEGRGGRTLGWFLLPTIFLPSAYVVYRSLASASGSFLGDFASGAASQLFTNVLSVSSLLWIAWIPILVYSALARDPARIKVGWVLRRIASALVVFLIFFVLALTMWFAFGMPSSGALPPSWVSSTSNALLLIGVSSLVAFLSPFSFFIGGTVISIPVLIASFVVAAVVGKPLVRARAVSQAAPPRLNSDHATLKVIVRLHGSKGHKDVEMLVDTGATDTNIPPSLARDLGISSGFGFRMVKLADGTGMKVGRSNAIIEYGPRKARVPVEIGPVAEPLLGITTLKALGLKVDPVARKLEPS